MKTRRTIAKKNNDNLILGRLTLLSFFVMVAGDTALDLVTASIIGALLPLTAIPIFGWILEILLDVFGVFAVTMIFASIVGLLVFLIEWQHSKNPLESLVDAFVVAFIVAIPTSFASWAFVALRLLMFIKR
jgi:hypothetical protein